MLASLKLLLPALTPSWRFFDSVGPSPRIEYCTPEGWREFRPRPEVVTWRQMLARLFWNPERNESLFLTSCAERLLESPNPHSVGEIEARLGVMGWLQWRIVVISRRDAGLVREVAWLSLPRGGA